VDGGSRRFKEFSRFQAAGLNETKIPAELPGARTHSAMMAVLRRVGGGHGGDRGLLGLRPAHHFWEGSVARLFSKALFSLSRRDLDQ